MSSILHVLTNGLRVVLTPCEAESVAVGLFIASGSRHETAKTAGISHFIEHMLFKGTPTRRPIDITRAIEGRGGNFNACTNEESTCYYAHLPSEYLAEALDILSDMYLHASLATDEFNREKQVILEEIKMYADEPDSLAMENLQRNLFPRSQLGAPIGGTAASLGPMRPVDLRRHIAAHYRADNTIVALAGAFDPERAVRLVAQVFAHLPKLPRTPHKHRAELFATPVGLAQTKKDIQQAQLALGYRMFGIGDKRKYAAIVMDAVLGRGMSSRLFQEVREKRGLSYDIASRLQLFSDAGMFTVTAGLDAGKTEKTLQTIDRELERIRERPLSAAELKRTKDFLIGNFRLGHERVTSKLFFFGQMMLAFGRIVTPEEQVAELRKVTTADVQSVARAIFRKSNRSVSWVLPNQH